MVFTLIFLSLVSVNSAFASATNGTIDPTFKNAWGENIGWLNFGCDNCNVHVTDSAISGNAWSSQYGWINLNPTTSGVTNDSEGALSGFAWSSNLGWINFNGVTIDSNGEFLGYATIQSDNSQINFNCANGSSCSSADFKVKTDWRPLSVRNPGSDGSSGSSHGGSHPVPPPPSATPPPTNPVMVVIGNIINFFNPPVKNPETNIIVQVPEIPPLAFAGGWNLLPVEAIRAFVFAPLPYEVRVLTAKFPELDKTLKSVGVERLTDLSKLTGVTLNLPGLSELTNTLKGVGAQRLADVNKLNSVGLDIPGLSNLNPNIPIGTGVGTGKIALIQGLPLAKFTLSEKKNLPTEFVFARGAGELVDLDVAISIGEKGQVAQTISSLPGQTLKLVIKPISSASSVTGYFIFKSATPKVAQKEIPRSSLLASALFSMNDLVKKAPDPVPVENKLVLSSFEYTDPDHDGIYTADVVSPATPGEYEIITVINYIDPELGTRQIRMSTVVDPEGYVFEKNNGKETRIPEAVVSLYVLNNSTKQYELWPAKDYSQENPQTTDVRGTYSFLVPEGSYYFHVEAPSYEPYESKVFAVNVGAGIHQNIELKSGWKLIPTLDAQTIILIVVLLLLVYNLYRNRMRDKLLKQIEVTENKNDGK